jgi:bacterioferritin-associated ferredoxin
MPIPRRWTDEQLREAVAASTSYKLVCRRLGLSGSGGNKYHVRARARELALDVSHFGARTIERCTDDEIRRAILASTSFVQVFAALGVKPGGTANGKLRARIRELGLETAHFRRAREQRRVGWTDDQLRAAVASSESYAQVIRKLGLVPAGGNYVQVQRRIRALALDTSHFTGMGGNVGLKLHPRPSAPLEEVLVEDRPTGSHKLKRRLFRAGLKRPACELCGWAERASDGRLPVELDHINGDNRDNRIENLRILCPNCHSLQPTHRGLNQKKRRPP